MENLGALAVLLAFCLSVYAVAASLVGKWKSNAFLTVSGERAVYSIWFLLTVASGLLIYALMTGDFRLNYVAQHSNKAMSIPYKFAAWWGGQEGSLLFWSWILSSYSAIVAFMNRKRFRDMMPYVISIIAATQCFFLVLNTFVVSPFTVLVEGSKMPVAIPDGNGLNPLLQYWTMAIHPPMLYLGYVGFLIPFAFAMGSLITKQPGEAWIATTRRWTLVTWLFQTTGILLGAGWAYAVLGWGGYWNWDAVENASFLPWLTGTAFLHSVMMQEKKGMMKVWNMVLISSTFFLCIFGTTLTRTGVVSSVHAFASSPVGPYFTTYLCVGITATIVLIVSRLDYLKSEAPLESIVSRESSFMFNNLILLASCFAILWGTLFPVISEYVKGEKIAVGPQFFNRVNIPIGLFLLFLTGVGPLIAWRRSSFESLRRAFMIPAVLGVGVSAGLFAAGMREFYPLMSFGIAMFVVASIMIEFWKGASAIHSKTGMNLVASAIELTHRNTRRYGGYIVHLGIVSMFIGFTGAAFNRDTTVEVGPGDKADLGAYHIVVKDIKQGENDNYVYIRSVLDVSKDGSPMGTMSPERRVYKSSGQQTSEVAIRRRLDADFYMNFAGPSTVGEKYVLQIFLFPLVSWIWIGFWVVLAGTLVCLTPNKIRSSSTSPRVEAETSKLVPSYATVEK